MKLLYDQSKKKLEQAAVRVITNEIKSFKKKQINLAICGGTSVNGIFKGLKKANIPWKKVHIFMVDERLVSINSKKSNFKLAHDTFIDALVKEGKLPEKNVHPFIYEPKKRNYGVTYYNNLIKKHGGKFDIVLLSSGEDNHIAALFPKHHSIKDKAEFFLTMKDSPKPPKGRMSSSTKLLMKSKTAILLFFGVKKKKALNNFFASCDTLYNCPESFIKKIPKSYILTDSKLAWMNSIKKHIMKSR